MDSEKANEAGKHLYLIVVVSVIILMLVTEATSYFGVYSLVVLLAIHLWIMARNNTLQFVNNIILPALLPPKIHVLDSSYQRDPSKLKRPLLRQSAQHKDQYTRLEQIEKQKLVMVPLKDMCKSHMSTAQAGHPKLHRNMSANPQTYSAQGKKGFIASTRSTDFEGEFQFAHQSERPTPSQNYRPRINELPQNHNIDRPAATFRRVSQITPAQLEISAERQKNHLKHKREQFTKTLKSMNMLLEDYVKMLKAVKAMMITDITGLVQEHQTNMLQLDHWLSTHFGRRLFEALYEQDQTIDLSSPNVVTLGQLHSHMKTEAITSDMIWQPLKRMSKATQKALFEELKELMEKRQAIDACILFDEGSREMARPELIIRLNRILNSLKFTDLVSCERENEESQTHSDSELAHHFFVSIINISKSTSKDGTQVPLIQSNRDFATLRKEDKTDVLFIKEGCHKIEFHVGCDRKMYKCQPGDSNLLSALTIAIALLKTKKSQDRRYTTILERWKRLGI